MNSIVVTFKHRCTQTFECGIIQKYFKAFYILLKYPIPNSDFLRHSIRKPRYLFHHHSCRLKFQVETFKMEPQQSCQQVISMWVTWAILYIQAPSEASIPQSFPPEVPLLPGGIEAGVELHLVVVVTVRVETLAWPIRGEHCGHVTSLHQSEERTVVTWPASTNQRWAL